MDDSILTSWLSLESLCWSILRVALVWMALHGVGSLVLKIRGTRKYFGLLPQVVAGMLAYMLIALLLSFLNILSRMVLSIFIFAGGIAGILRFYRYLRERTDAFSFSFRHSVMILPFLLAGYVIVTGFMIAGRPELNFNDTQVTYLVHPDRWLNEGNIHFIDETTFSAFPMTSELLLLLPSSLAVDRMDQLILGQVFEWSMVLALILVSMLILRFKWKWFAAGFISIMGCSTILLWCHMAKPDATALFFVTIALSLMLVQMKETSHRNDLSAFLIMGLALATKYTAYIALIPFLMMYATVVYRYKPGIRNIILSGSVLLVLPITYMIRTFIFAGSPFFPHAALFDFLLKDRWKTPDINLTYSIYNDRSSYFYPSVGFFQNIGHYFSTWNSSIFLLFAGYFHSLGRRMNIRRNSIILAGIIIYAVLSLVLFYPAWWGAKYGILLIPFAAIAGMYMLRRYSHGLILATMLAMVIYLLYDSPYSPTERYGIRFRNGMISSYLTGTWVMPNTPVVEEQEELDITLWMNSHLPDSSTILSFYATKRYFSTHRFLVAWRYPPAGYLYLENTLEEEIDIMESMGIDYVLLRAGDPAPFDDENAVELFSRIGLGDILEPVASLNNYAVYSFNPDAVLE